MWNHFGLSVCWTWSLSYSEIASGHAPVLRQAVDKFYDKFYSFATSSRKGNFVHSVAFQVRHNLTIAFHCYKTDATIKILRTTPGGQIQARRPGQPDSEKEGPHSSNGVKVKDTAI